MGPSRLMLGLGVGLLLIAEVLRRLRAGLDENYQTLFRERVTRNWYHLSVPGAYLAVAPPRDQIPPEVSKSLGEACRYVTGQNPKRTAIEERVFSDSDSYHSWSFILADRALLTSRVKLRALVWFRALAIVPSEPRLDELRTILRSRAAGRTARAFVSTTGIWGAVMLDGRPFLAPVTTSCLVPESYSSWKRDAELLNDRAIVRALLAI